MSKSTPLNKLPIESQNVIESDNNNPNIDINELTKQVQLEKMMEENKIPVMQNEEHNNRLQNQLLHLQSELNNMKQQNQPDCPGGVCELKRPSTNTKSLYDALNLQDDEVKKFVSIFVCHLILSTPQINGYIFDKISDYVNNDQMLLMIKSIFFTIIVFVIFKYF